MILVNLRDDIRSRKSDWIYFVVSFFIYTLGIISVIDTVFIPFREDFKYDDYILRAAAFVTLIFFSISFYKHFKRKRIDRVMIAISFSVYTVLLLALTEYGFGVAVSSILIASLLFITAVSNNRKIVAYFIAMLSSIVLIIILQYNDIIVREKIRNRTFETYSSALNTICIIILLGCGITLIILLKGKSQNDKVIEKLRKRIDQKEEELKKQVLEILEQGTLTEREKDVFKLYALGLESEEIQEELDIRQGTVKSHYNNIALKIGRKTFEGIRSSGVKLRQLKNLSD